MFVSLNQGILSIATNKKPTVSTELTERLSIQVIFPTYGAIIRPFISS
jgi:hypothetical protein